MAELDWGEGLLPCSGAVLVDATEANVPGDSVPLHTSSEAAGSALAITKVRDDQLALALVAARPLRPRASAWTVALPAPSQRTFMEKCLGASRMRDRKAAIGATKRKIQASKIPF